MPASLEAAVPQPLVWGGDDSLGYGGRACWTPAASGGVGGPSGSGRALAAVTAVADGRVLHDWGPWSPLAYTGTKEDLEQRVSGVCGHEQIVASDCLGVRPQRPAGTSAARRPAVVQ